MPLPSISKYPQRLLLLGKSEDRVPCKLRQDVAKHLLGTKPADLEINARKVQKLFSANLRVAADTCILSEPLKLSVRTVVKMWKADSRECERVNNMLKLFTEQGPTSSDELISSRACIEHYLGEACKPGAIELRRKWSHYHPNARRLLQLRVFCWADRLQVSEDTERRVPTTVGA